MSAVVNSVSQTVNNKSAVEKVCVAYAAPAQQFHIDVVFEAGMTILNAIEKSGIQNHIELPNPLHVGIFGAKVADLNQCLKAGDRVEIYRALTINPKDIRRKRAKANPSSKYCRSNRFKQLN